MTSACIVQARMGSTRLPGKIMRRLAGETVLSHVLRRCRAIPGIDIVVCATVMGQDGEPVAFEAERAGAVVFRGSESDVLGRYLGAARAVRATRIMRVTSDCPLIDPALCSEVLAACGRRRDGSSGADYVSNNMPPSWPHGLDCEAFTGELLERAAEKAVTPYAREHVTPWMQDSADVVREDVTGPGGALARMRWTLDYPEDFDFLEALFDRLPRSPSIPSRDAVLAVLEADPGLSLINAARRAA